MDDWIELVTAAVECEHERLTGQLAPLPLRTTVSKVRGRLLVSVAHRSISHSEVFAPEDWQAVARWAMAFGRSIALCTEILA